MVFVRKFLFLICIVSTHLLGFSLELLDMIDEKAPLFTLEDTNGKTHSLSEYQGKKILLFFFGKDDDRDFEEADFRYSYNNEHLVLLDRLNPWFIKNNIVVLGISDYTKEKLQALAARDAVTLTLLSDAKSRLIAYLYGTAHSLVGIERSIFLINEEGIISYALQSNDPAELVVSALIEILKKIDGNQVITKRLLDREKDRNVFSVENPKMQELVNQKASLFTLKDSEGSEHSLKDYYGKKILLCFFNRRLDYEIENPCSTFEDVITTFKCLNEAKPWLEKHSIEFLTVFNDNPKDILFLKKHSLIGCKEITLHDNKEEDLMKQYEVIMQSDYQLLKQATFFIDEEGIIRFATDARSSFEQLYYVLCYLLKEKIENINQDIFN
jgi:peroxiredoxin Q/BCP